MTKTFVTKTQDALALAVAAAAVNIDKMAARKPEPKPPATAAREGLQQLNIRIAADAHRKLKGVAFAWDTTVRDLLEAFIGQLPDVPREHIAAPPAVQWAKPKKLG